MFALDQSLVAGLSGDVRLLHRPGARTSKRDIAGCHVARLRAEARRDAEAGTVATSPLRALARRLSR